VAGPGARTDYGPASEDHAAVSVPSLKAFLDTLGDVPDPDTVSYAICWGLLAPFEPHNSAIYRMVPGERAIELLASHGADPRMAKLYRSLALDMHLPVTEAARTGTQQMLSAQYVADNYPLTAPYYKSRPPEGEVAYLPLRHRGAVAGIVTVEFDAPIQRTWNLHEAFEVLCSAVALWLLAREPSPARHVTGFSGRSSAMQFTDRQREIILLMRTGRTNRDIAQTLGYSIATIKADITSLGLMLGARGRDEILQRADRAGV